jgi:hypothetical protein
MNIKCEDTIIGNVSDYLLWVKETNKAEVISDEGQPICFENNNIYYRGQSCSCWELKPSVFREPILDEHSLLNKASLKLWNEVSSLRTHLEKMIFFQHYGLCTRLLDVTFNPLVALYMACCEEKWNTCDGVVFCGYSVERRNDKIAELTAKYVFENELQLMVVGFHHFLKAQNVKIDSFTQPIFILPPINNPRIEAQNGAFIMVPLIDKIIDEETALLNMKSLNGTEFFDERRAIIKGYDKESILHELSILGIDSGTIYKGIEEKLKAIVIEEKWNINRNKNIKFLNSATLLQI